MPDSRILRGIELLDSATNKYAFRIESKDAGSTSFNLKLSIVGLNSGVLYYIPQISKEVISFDQSMSKNNVNTSYHFIPRYKNDVMLFFYLRGSYRRLDNTGLFTINNVYGYNISGKTTTITKGLTKQNVIAVVQKNEK